MNKVKLSVINGPNINLLGVREPEIYGRESYACLCEKITAHCQKLGIEVKIGQSNSEGGVVDMIQNAYFEGFDGIVINPAAYTHTSVAVRDAIAGVGLPCVEVHISDVDSREDFRRVNFIRSVCIANVSGKGPDGYLEAVDVLVRHIQK